MAVPGRSIDYVDQSSTDVGEAVAFALDDGNWTENPTSFEVAKLPPDFTLTDGLNLGGVTECHMEYTIFVRGVNTEGAGEFLPLRWTVASIASTNRTLYGIPLVYPATPQIPAATAASVILQAAGLNPPAPGLPVAGPVGKLLVNDIAVNGTAARYGFEFLNKQLVVSAAGASFFRATNPGFEITIDTN